MRDLFDFTLDAEFVCHDYLSRSTRPPLVRLPYVTHTAVFSPSGGGKGVSLVVPFLQSCDESCVVIDFKGENAAITAALRARRFKHRVVLLDPYRVVTATPDCFNPLDFIDRDSPFALDECDDLAKALVIRAPEEREPHWSDSAEAWISAVLGTVIYYGERTKTRSLQTVRDILSSPDKLDTAVRLMLESTCWDGMLARKGAQLLHFVEKERSSTLTSVGRHLRFLDTPATAASTQSSSFDPAELRSGTMTVYCILPPEHMRAQSALLRVWIGSLLRAVVQKGLQEYRKTHFILDEAASLGRLEAVDDAVDKYRGYGVRLQFYYQSLAQLKRCFPEGQDVTLLSNCTQIYFGCNDTVVAEQVSTRLGEATIAVESGGTSRGYSKQTSTSMQQQTSQTYSSNESSNWQQQARRLLKPDEVLQLPRRVAITFTPGVPPILTVLIRYYEEKNLVKQPGLIGRAFSACATLIASIVLCATSLAMAWGLGGIAEREGPGSILRLLVEQ